MKYVPVIDESIHTTPDQRAATIVCEADYRPSPTVVVVGSCNEINCDDDDDGVCVSICVGVFEWAIQSIGSLFPIRSPAGLKGPKLTRCKRLANNAS